MQDKKEIAAAIFEKLRCAESINETLTLIRNELQEEKTEKLKLTRTPVLNAIGQELGKLLLKVDWKFEKLKDLWEKGRREEKLIVISALGRIAKKDYHNTKNFVLSILDDITDWELCDQLALRVVVHLATQNQKELFLLMQKWASSSFNWTRRLAVATIPPYIRAKPEESRICLEFLDRLMQEENKDVKKAISWALREITKKDPKSVFEFLLKWAKVKDSNTKWIIKDGMKKLSLEQQTTLKALIEG